MADEPRGSKHATGDWPKMYLLQLYNAAIDHGAIWVQPLTEARAASLRGAFNRLRRRSDTSMAGTITPQMLMVSMGQWQPGPDGQGRVPVMYNKLPDGIKLPEFVPMEGQPPVAMPMPASMVPPASPDLDTLMSAASMELDANDIEGYLSKMRKAAASHE